MDQVNLLLMGILPLLAFAIVDSFAGLKPALYTAIAFALFELGVSIYWFGEVDWITGLSVILVLVLALVCFKSKKDIHFKMQPVILSLVFAAVMLISYWSGEPILLAFIDKYADKLPLEMQDKLSHPMVRPSLHLMTFYGGLAMLAHATCTAWCAFKLSKWWWLAMRGFGFYLFLGLATFATGLELSQ
jgi:intracellular septation protein